MNDPRLNDILDIVAKETALPRESLRLDATIAELGIPSLDLVQTIFALETHFHVEIPLVESTSGPEFATLGDLVAQVIATLDAAGAPAAAEAARSA